jgi:hypothetical protein
MNRRDFLKFLGGAAVTAAVAPQMLAEAASTGSSGFSGATGIIGPQGPPGPIGRPGPECIVLDYTMTVQQAIDALPKQGGIVYIPSGTWIVNETICIPEEVRLVAEGDLGISDCHISGMASPRGEAPILLLMDEDDNVEIIGNSFDCEQLPFSRWFEVPIGDHLAALRVKMDRLYLKMKQFVT